MNARVVLLFCLLASGAAAAPLRIPGITAPIREARLSANVPGTVLQVHVEEGDVVKEGDLLVELDQGFERLEVERRKLIAESKAELEAAQHRVALLENEWEVTRRLFESTRSVSEEDRDRKELEYKLARADLKRLEALEQQEEIEYNMAQEQLNRRRIRAPWDGVVTRIFVKEGEGCDPRQPLVALVDPSRCEFVCNVPPAQARRLRVAGAVMLLVEDGDTPVERQGTVFYVSPVVDPASGLQEVKVRFDNNDGAVSPGVTAWLLLDHPEGS